MPRAPAAYCTTHASEAFGFHTSLTPLSLHSLNTPQGLWWLTLFAIWLASIEQLQASLWVDGGGVYKLLSATHKALCGLPQLMFLACDSIYLVHALIPFQKVWNVDHPLLHTHSLFWLPSSRYFLVRTLPDALR